MARILPLLALLFTAAAATGGLPDRLHKYTKPARQGILCGGEKLSHLHFYWHDIVTGPKPTTVTVARAAVTNSTIYFGTVNIFDDPLTAGPESSSCLVGRAQGLYAAAAQEKVGLLMAMNIVFVEEKYNRSTITVMGRNEIFSQVREMPIIGGSGLFRFARGYVQARTHSVDLKSGDAVVEYNCYVLHF